MSLPAMASSVASTLSGAQGGVEKLQPSYALACRFTVELGDFSTSWQKCTGLDIRFQNRRHNRGRGSRQAPGVKNTGLDYGPVTLTRAMDKVQSEKLRLWLGRMAQARVNGKDAAGESATICLYDSYGALVQRWVLKNARPTKWTGPTLDADSKSVATEQLVLEHKGFIEDDESHSAVTLKGDSGEIVFPYAPAEIVETKRSTARRSYVNVSQQQVTADGQRTNALATYDNVTTHVLRGLVLDESRPESGATAMQPSQRRVPEILATLEQWSTLVPTEDTRATKTRPALTLTWGKGIRRNVCLVSLDVTWNGVNAQGEPSRANVDLTLEDLTVDQPGRGGTNPTSGGIPGRTSVVMLASDSLPQMAQRGYGSPGRWRQIATANGVEDPFRVAPGATILLPAPAEVNTEGATGAGEGR